MQAEVLATERRRTPRFICSGSKDYFIQFDGEEGMGFLYNLSRRGLAFQYARPLQQGKNYRLEITGDADKIIFCEVEIIWNKARANHRVKTYGAKILKMDSGEKIEMLDFLYDVWRYQTSPK